MNFTNISALPQFRPIVVKFTEVWRLLRNIENMLQEIENLYSQCNGRFYSNNPVSNRYSSNCHHIHHNAELKYIVSIYTI